MLRTLLRGCAGVVMLGCATTALAQGGDSCASPQAVVATSLVTTVPMSTATPVSSEGHHASCDMKSGSTWYNSVDVWYDYTAFGNGIVNVTLSGCTINSNSSTASNLSQWASCGAADSATCNRGGTSCGSVLTFPIVAGQHYLIRAATFALSSSGTSQPRRGTATITFTEQGPPANDDCAHALDIAAGTTTWNDTLAQPNGPIPACADGPGEELQKDLWFAHTPSSNGLLALTNAGANISIHDTCAVTALACNFGSVSMFVNSGTRYLIRVSRWAGDATGSSSLVLASYAAPANDTCATAEEVGAGEFTWDDSGAAANAPFPTCGVTNSATQRDVWFAYTAALDGNATVDCRVATAAAPGNNNLATITVFTDCGGAQQIACASQSSGNRWLCFPVLSGQRYIVRLAHAGTAAREPWKVRIREFAPAAGDTWQTAAPLTLGTQTYSNIGDCDTAQFETAVNCYGVATPGTSTWLYLDPPADGIAVFDTSVNTSVDTVLVAYGSDANGDCNGVQLVCSNDLSPQYSLGSYISLPAHAGSRIYLRADYRAVGNSNGYYTNFTMTTDLLDPYPNDECTGATAITAGLAPASNLITFDNRAASKSIVPDPSCNAGGNLGPTLHDLWWKWTPTQNGVARISTCRNPAPLLSANATVLTVYSDCTLTHEVACNDDAGDTDISDFTWTGPCTDEQSALHFSALAQTTYLIRVAAHSEYIGPGVLNISFVPSACAPDFNNTNTLEVQDIFDFLNAWFAGSSAADFDGNGLAVSDIFAFLNAWFAGC
jgi:hypothetical protein